MRMKRSLWLKQQEEARESWIANHPKIGKLSLIKWLNLDGKYWIETRCECGRISKAKKADLVARIGSEIACRSCTMVRRNAAAMEDPKHIDKLMGNLELAKAKNRQAKLPTRVKQLRQTLSAAKARCSNKNDAAWANYGGRGIEFRFSDVATGSEWVINNIGHKPSPSHSLDRIDNDGHYEPGNLRWATRREQMLNRRAFKLGSMGERIRYIQSKRQDLCYEAIRYSIKKGLTNDQIINKQKGKHSTSI